MKYLVIPILKLIWCLLIFIVYAFEQIIHIFWHAKPRKNLINHLVRNDYHCISHRYSLHTTIFHTTERYIITVKPKSLFEWYKWVFKYGPTGEVLEISEKERYYYERYLEDIQNENSKES